MMPSFSEIAYLLTVKGAVIFIVMTVAAFIAARFKNAGLVDVVWAAGLAGLALIDAVFAGGDPLHRLLMASMVGIANIRLAWHLWLRFRHEFPKEDARYHKMRLDWESQHKPANLLFYGVFLFQGVLLLLLSIPFTLIATSTSAQLTVLDDCALIIWMLAFMGEAIADQQLKVYKRNPDNQGTTCKVGLWRYSRHPNYFFEWILWCAYYILAIAAPYGVWTFYMPLLMLYFLTCVTGVTLAEEQSLKSRGDEYRAYQKSTSPFIPWFPKPGV